MLISGPFFFIIIPLLNPIPDHLFASLVTYFSIYSLDCGTRRHPVCLWRVPIPCTRFQPALSTALSLNSVYAWDLVSSAHYQHFAFIVTAAWGRSLNPKPEDRVLHIPR